MSSNKTPNLGLHSWIGGDRVYRTEFNDNFQKLDAVFSKDMGHAHDGTPSGGTKINAEDIICNVVGITENNVKGAVEELFIEADSALKTLNDSIGGGGAKDIIIRTIEQSVNELREGREVNLFQNTFIDFFKSPKTVKDYQEYSFVDIANEVKNLITPNKWIGSALPVHVREGKTFVNEQGIQVGTLTESQPGKVFYPQPNISYINPSILKDAIIPAEPSLISGNILIGKKINGIIGNATPLGYTENGEKVGYVRDETIPDYKVETVCRYTEEQGKAIDIIDNYVSITNLKTIYVDNYKKLFILEKREADENKDCLYVIDKFTNTFAQYFSTSSTFRIKHIIKSSQKKYGDYVFIITSENKLIKWDLTSSGNPYYLTGGTLIDSYIDEETLVATDGLISWKMQNGKYKVVRIDRDTGEIIKATEYDTSYKQISEYSDMYYAITTDNKFICMRDDVAINFTKTMTFFTFFPKYFYVVPGFNTTPIILIGDDTWMCSYDLSSAYDNMTIRYKTITSVGEDNAIALTSSKNSYFIKNKVNMVYAHDRLGNIKEGFVKVLNGRDEEKHAYNNRFFNTPNGATMVVVIIDDLKILDGQGRRYIIYKAVESDELNEIRILV